MPNFWRHQERDPVRVAALALQTARDNTWTTLEPLMQTRLLRAFLVMSLQAATLQPEPQTLGVLSEQSFADEERNAMGAALARTPMLLAPDRFQLRLSSDLFSLEGLPMMGGGDPGTGLAPLAVVAIVIAASAAAAFIADRVVNLIASVNFQNRKTERLMASQTTAIEVIAKHVEREKVAGGLLPYGDEERQVLQELQGVQKEIADERQVPLPSPFDGAREFLKTAGEAAGSILPLVVAAGVGWLVLTNHDARGTREETA